MKKSHLFKKISLLIALLGISMFGVAQTQVTPTFNGGNAGTGSVIIGGTTFTSWHQWGGSGNATTSNNAKITVTGDCTITLYAGASSGTGNRNFTVTGNGFNQTQANNATQAVNYNYTGGAGEVTIFPAGGGGRLYAVFVTYANPPVTLSVTPTSLTGFTTPANTAGAEQSFTVSGANLTAGNIVITAPAGYEISTTSGGAFGATATIAATAGTLTSTNVYVRLAAQAVNPSVTGNITVNGSAVGATSNPTVALSGSVTPEPTIKITPDPAPSFSFIEGQAESAVVTLYVSGENLPAGDVSINPMNFQFSTSPTGPFAFAGITVVSNFPGGTLAPTAFYVKLVFPNNPPVGTIRSGGATPIVYAAGTTTSLLRGNQLSLEGEVLPAPTNPTLTVNPTQITGLDYVFGMGPSTAQSFNVSGALLVAGTPITITAPEDFEVSLSQNSGFAASVQIANTAGGTLANTPVYVRLAAGKAINSYTRVATVIGGGDVTVYNIDLTGAVTPAPLPAPTPGTPDTPTEEGFTAYWNAITGAVGYTVNVYQNGVFVTTVNATAGETSKVITGLHPSTTYTFKVIALGDGTNNTNSPESVNSSPITTDMAPISITSPCGDNMVSLYFTDFTGWVTKSGGSSGDFTASEDGFKTEGGINVNNGTQGISTGSSNRRVQFPPFNFLGGGTVVFEVDNVTNTNRNISLSGSTEGSIPVPRAGTYTFNFPASFTGEQNLVLTFSNGGFVIKSITVCSNPGTNPLITTTPMPTVTQSMSAPIGGNTATNVILVKGFNLTGDVTVSVVGDLAGFFTPSLTTIPMASALTGRNLAITYRSSSIVAIHTAQLKLSSPGAADVFISLMGVSTPAGAAPVIIADDAELPFWTTEIRKAYQTLDVAGYNLTEDITLSITGANAGFFAVQPPSISRADALSGKTITIVYTGDIVAGTEHTATLVITSSGVTVEVPLRGYTLGSRPEMFELKFVVSPPYAGYVRHTPGGTNFLKGTVVTAQVTAETGYVIDYWSDAGGNRSPQRNFTVSDLKKGTITIFMREDQGVIVDPTNTFVAYPPENITQTEFTGGWSDAEDAIDYVVNVYDVNKSPIQSNLPAGMGNSLVVTGLAPGEFYYYEVIATVPVTTANPSGKKQTELVGPFQTLKVPTVFVCGE